MSRRQLCSNNNNNNNSFQCIPIRKKLAFQTWSPIKSRLISMFSLMWSTPKQTNVWVSSPARLASASPIERFFRYVLSMCDKLFVIVRDIEIISIDRCEENGYGFSNNTKIIHHIGLLLPLPSFGGRKNGEKFLGLTTSIANIFVHMFIRQLWKQFLKSMHAYLLIYNDFSASS